MKNERKRTQDLITLSAYLDDELDKTSRQELETQLNQEPVLRNKLERLRMTKVMLGHLPRHNAPRNFMLTPDMVKVRRRVRKPLFAYLKLATSLAAILLVVMVGVELLVFGRPQDRSPMTTEPMMEVATIADKPTPEPLILWAEPGFDRGQGELDIHDLGSADTFIDEEPVVEIEVAPPEEGPLPKEPPIIEAEPEMAPFQVEAEPKQDMLILGIKPDQGGEIIERSEPARLPEEIPQPTPNMIRLMQIALVMIAMGGGVTLWFLQRRNLS